MNMYNKGRMLSEEELKKVTGGGDMTKEEFLAWLEGLTSKFGVECPCEGCDDKVAKKALKNHLMNIHGLTEAQAQANMSAEMWAIQE